MPYNCHYCGEILIGKAFSQDHVRPKVRGGSNKRRNLVPCCNVCNSIKGPRRIEQVRYRLVQKMIGWPRFSLMQIDWLRSKGFDMAEYDDAKLVFERTKLT